MKNYESKKASVTAAHVEQYGDNRSTDLEWSVAPSEKGGIWVVQEMHRKVRDRQMDQWMSGSSYIYRFESGHAIPSFGGY
jgi:hypothetical protein